MVDALVVNASPLIFLGNAGRIPLLRISESSRVIVPQAVFDEVVNSGRADRASSALVDAGWIEKAAGAEPPRSVIEWDLGLGESAVIATALSHTGSRVVIDDLAGRRCALAHGLSVVGTIGIVIFAHRRGAISDPRAVLQELRSAGMWLSDAVIENALRVAGIP